MNTALNYTGCYLYSFPVIGIGISIGTTNGILIAAAIELVLIIVAISIIRKIAKKNPPKSMFKMSMLMIGCAYGCGVNVFLKALGKGIDIMAELEKHRQNRVYSIERHFSMNSIKYREISHDGYSYIDEDGEKQNVEPRIYDMYSLF